MLTETQIRRRGPLGRLITARPWVADVALAAAVLLLGTVSAVVASMTVEGPRASDSSCPAPARHGRSRRRGSLGPSWGGAPDRSQSVAAGRHGRSHRAGRRLARHGGRAGSPRGLSRVRAVLRRGRPRCTDHVDHVRRGVRPGLARAVVVAGHRPRRDAPVERADDPVAGRARPAARRAAVLLGAPVCLGDAPARAPAARGGDGIGARARRLHALELVERYDAMARERDQIAALARESERARIAREMHDIVAHNVSVMVALSDGAGAALDRAPTARARLRELSRTGRAALSDMQRVLDALDPGEGTDETRGRPEPTATDLGAVVERFRAVGVPVTATGLDVPLPQDTALRLAVVRIVTEALTNILRHAPGTRRPWSRCDEAPRPSRSTSSTTAARVRGRAAAPGGRPRDARARRAPRRSRRCRSPT
ncbi:histidine kinase [Oerskovia sp. M15]